MSGASLMGLAVGVAAGLVAGLLAAPMSGAAMRARVRERAGDGGDRLQSLASSGRQWALQAFDHGMTLLEEGRRAFNTTQLSPPIEQPVMLTATLGEIARLHGTVRGMEATS